MNIGIYLIRSNEKKICWPTMFVYKITLGMQTTHFVDDSKAYISSLSEHNN